MTMAAQAGFDLIALEICWGCLISSGDETAAAVPWTSFSTIMRESTG